MQVFVYISDYSAAAVKVSADSLAEEFYTSAVFVHVLILSATIRKYETALHQK